MNPIPVRSGQRGVVLAVVLILLLVMTLLAVASLSGTMLEERMSAAQLDRNLSMQAAEAALREAEEVVREDKPTTVTPADDDPAKACAAGLCAAPANATQFMRWSQDSFWADGSGTWAEATIDLGDLTAKPRYIIELMDDAVPDPESCTTGGDVSLESTCTLTSSRYRITVRSADDGRAVVMLQSIYVVP